MRTTTTNTSSSTSRVEESIDEKEEKPIIEDKLQRKEDEDEGEEKTHAKEEEEDGNDDDDDDEGEGNKSPVVVHLTPQQMSQRQETQLKHIVFGIAASSNLWSTRKEYIKTWWRPKQTRGVVWLDQKVPTQRNEGLPEIRISSDTSKFKYTNRQGQRSALRISRIVTETLKLGMEDVRWFVMGDDDTVFVVDNVVSVLNKYDHRHFYYVGSSSESHYDVYGDLLGLLGAHPVTPLVSLHHLDVVEPIFPGMTRVRSVRHLMESVNQDSSSIIQQSICYDKNRYWSISVSWGYVVQILRGVMSPRELEMPSRTFLNWYKRADYTAYAFNTRPVYKHPCEKPFVYYMSRTHYDSTKKQTIGVYMRNKYSKSPHCRWRMDSPDKITSIVVMKRRDPLRWKRSPRRDCCRIIPSRKSSSTMYLMVSNCRDGEVTEL
ncbi:unnamed protein product [Lupinus luteus]|uniref:Uncharacterized protein n=1 Tax=Lupinus luteus TaxID=3873 RepID=A0AAV1XRJ4_LUPLU